MKKYSRDDQKAMAIWAADCAERVLFLFEKGYPKDSRPREAIEVCRRWIDSGQFSMAEIRRASLAAHAAAREAEANVAASCAARAAGQAVATAHVPQHAYGAAYYALKAIAAADPANAEASVSAEYEWQSGELPETLRKEIMQRIVVRKRKSGGVTITINKTGDF